jgi:3-deoxy-manno-octulosonate cytidylyltransferase (CMP-KDO synthetase)
MRPEGSGGASAGGKLAFDLTSGGRLTLKSASFPDPVNSMRVHGIIPARYASSRFPGKPLVPIAGKPLVQWVYERAREARALSRVIVATDDERIAAVIRGVGGEAIMTRSDHASGTDRMAEVARRMPADIHVNIQGDEPLLETGDIDRLVACFRAEPDLDMATLALPLTARSDADDPNIVKVVCDAASRALYFSRSAIPSPGPAERSGAQTTWLRHIGIYAFRHAFLLEFASWPRGDLEQAERLEQLRALEHGRAIKVIPATGRYLGVDTPEDAIAVEKALADRS